MHKAARGFLLLGTALVAVGGLLAVTGWLSRQACDLAEPLVAAASMVEGRRLGEDLDARREATARQLLAKEEVVEEAVAGRLTLAEAAARFGELSLAKPDFDWTLFRSEYPGPSDEERLCQAVLRWARQRRTILPDHHAEIVRLRHELQERHESGQPRPTARGE